MSTKVICSFLGMGAHETLSKLKLLLGVKTKFIHSGFSVEDLKSVIESERYSVVICNFGESVDDVLFKTLLYSKLNIDWVLPSTFTKGLCIHNIQQDGLSKTAAYKHFYYWEERLEEFERVLTHVINKHHLTDEETLFDWFIKTH